MEVQIKEMKGMFNKDLEELKNKEMNNTITEMKNTLEGINRTTESEGQVSELEDRMEEITVAGQRIKKRRNEDSLRDFWDNTKYRNR